jgi:hypothetical protein
MERPVRHGESVLRRTSEPLVERVVLALPRQHGVYTTGTYVSQPVGLSAALVRNWSSLFLNRVLKRGERSVTARDVLLQVELVRFAQFAWHAVASAKEGRWRLPSARELADYSES